MKDFGPLGAGYPIFYELKKSLIYAMFILSLIYSIPVTIMIGIKIWAIPKTLFSTIPKISTFNFFKEDDDFIIQNMVTYGNAAIYLICAAIVFLIFYSIFLRRKLIKLVDEIDDDEVTASDFAILAKGLPRNLS